MTPTCRFMNLAGGERQAMTKEFLNIDDLSELLRIKKSTLYSLVENGDLPHYKIGRLIRFRRNELDTWIKGHRRERVAPEKKAKEIVKELRNPEIDIGKIVRKAVEEVKNRRYNVPHGKPDRIKGLRREVSHGTL
jgi:excisionase family DNA binding protein